METSRKLQTNSLLYWLVRESASERCNVDKMTNLSCNINDHKYKTDEIVIINLSHEKCINNQMRKYRIQRNNYQVSKQIIKTYTIYFYKIPLRNMSHHLELFIDR